MINQENYSSRKTMKNICPICFYDGLFEPPYNSHGYGSYEICPCCGFEFGYDDYPNKEEQIMKWRKKWIADGYPWFSPEDKPVDWNLPEQFKESL